MSKSIDPYSHPNTDELPLREAAEAAHKTFTEYETGKTTGVKFIGIGKDKIIFYCHDEKAMQAVPESYRGWPCEASKADKKLPQPYHKK